QRAAGAGARSRDLVGEREGEQRRGDGVRRQGGGCGGAGGGQPAARQLTMRAIRLHDTRSGELRQLAPRTAGKVSIYACGPTVYGRIHVGNARPYVVFSLLKRFLQHEGYEVTLVVNITDVNDKIYDAARAERRPSAELAARMAELYRQDTDALELGRPDHEPLASQTMAPIIDHIAALIDSGPAYVAAGDVHLRVRPA